MTVTVRRAVEADLSAVARVGQITWPTTYLPFAGQDYVDENLDAWWSEAALQQALDGLLLVAEAPTGEIVGCLEIGDYDGVPVMWKLYVLPDRQAHGVASMLLDMAIEELSSPVLLTEYIAENEAAGHWYARKGFRELRREARPGGLEVVWLELDLRAYLAADDSRQT